MDFARDILPLKDRLYRLALRLTMQHEEAEDIVQDTLLKLWNIISRGGKIDNIEAYAIAMCRNLALDRLRQNSHNTVSYDSGTMPEAPGENPYDRIFVKEGMKIVAELMSHMPEKLRTCMQLRDFEGMSYHDISKALDITEDQVRVNIFRARKFIKERLESLN